MSWIWNISDSKKQHVYRLISQEKSARKMVEPSVDWGGVWKWFTPPPCTRLTPLTCLGADSQKRLILVIVLFPFQYQQTLIYSLWDISVLATTHLPRLWNSSSNFESPVAKQNMFDTLISCHTLTLNAADGIICFTLTKTDTSKYLLSHLTGPDYYKIVSTIS